MSRKPQRVPYRLDPRGTEGLREDEVRAILRAAGDLVGKGGRSLLTKVLRGSRERRVLELKLNECPAHGFYRDATEERVLAHIDWMIVQGYLRVEYDNRLPVLFLTDDGWAIERDTYTDELLAHFDRMVDQSATPHDMTYLKDRDRAMILLLLDKVEATGEAKYVPLLRAWELVDHKKVQQRIRAVIRALSSVNG